LSKHWNEGRWTKKKREQVKIEQAVKDGGFRSRLEYNVNQQLKENGIKFSYEGPLNTIRYSRPEKGHRYLADFLLGNGIIIEAKGLFELADRQKHLLIKKQFPHLDIRFLFQNPNNTITKKSKTTYGAWCYKNGIQCCHNVIPQEWLNEVKAPEVLANIIKTLKGFRK
jgi:hypothetical protein